MILAGRQYIHPIALAPLAGWSDTVFRRLCKEFGADLVFSEMASADAIIREHRATYRLLQFADAERPIGLQIFGAEADIMARAVERVAQLQPDFIDLNFGCPSRKVVKRGAGAAILRDLAVMRDIARAACSATDLPVTAKLRSGWDSPVLLEASRILQDCGIAMITVHPRTQKMQFQGRADWSQIADVKSGVSIPVLGNGDIRNSFDAIKMLAATGCDGVMVGRAACGNPWIFHQIAEMMKSGREPEAVDHEQRLHLCIRHARLAAKYYGADRALHLMRKHLVAYLRVMPGAAGVRARLCNSKSYPELHDILNSYSP